MSSCCHFRLNITAEKRASEYAKWTVFIIFVQFLVTWYLFPRIYRWKGETRAIFVVSRHTRIRYGETKIDTK